MPERILKPGYIHPTWTESMADCKRKPEVWTLLGGSWLPGSGVKFRTTIALKPSFFR